MYDKVFLPDLGGIQTLDTFTVGFASDTATTDFLERSAQLGNGTFYQVKDGDQLTEALVAALNDIIEKSASFTAATVPSARTEDGSDFYQSYFFPRSKSAFWEGHIRAWTIEGERRNAGIAACRGVWTVEVDADERVPPELAGEIRAVAKSDAAGYFLIPFDNYIGDRRVCYGWGASWGVSAAPRLFYKGCKQWGGQRIHPSLSLRGPERRLENRMVHYVDRNISDMIHRLDRDTTARAAMLRTIDALYAGAMDPSGWPAFLAEARDLFGAACVGRRPGTWPRRALGDTESRGDQAGEMGDLLPTMAVP